MGTRRTGCLRQLPELLDEIEDAGAGLFADHQAEARREEADLVAELRVGHASLARPPVWRPLQRDRALGALAPGDRRAEKSATPDPPDASVPSLASDPAWEFAPLVS